MIILKAPVETGANEGSRAKMSAGLIDPVKLATLRERGANPRGQNDVAQLAEAKVPPGRTCAPPSGRPSPFARGALRGRAQI